MTTPREDLAVNDLIQRVRRIARQEARRLTANTVLDVDDLAQETLIRLMKVNMRWTTDEEETSNGLIRIIIRRIIIDSTRKRRPSIPLEEAADIPLANDGTYSRIYICDIKNLISKIATPSERDVFDLILDGRTAYEIGTTLGISASTARVHISNIRKKLLELSRADDVPAEKPVPQHSAVKSQGNGNSTIVNSMNSGHWSVA